MHGIVPGNTVWTYVGFVDGTSSFLQRLQRPIKICGTCLCYSGDSQSESEGDLDDVDDWSRTNDAAAANQDEEKRAQEFSGQHAPYVAVVRDVVESDHSLHTCIPTPSF